MEQQDVGIFLKKLKSIKRYSILCGFGYFKDRIFETKDKKGDWIKWKDVESIIKNQPLIDEKIKLPDIKTCKRYPWEKCEKVGDSFVINKYSRSLMQSLSGCSRLWAKNHNNNWKFAFRKTDDNKMRVFRIK